MDIPLDVEVDCTDEPCGRSTALVLNPVTREITHFVVATEGLLHSEYLVPIDQIEKSEPDCIQLWCSHRVLASMEPFHKVKFISLDKIDNPGKDAPADLPVARPAWIWPYLTAEGKYGTYANVEHIPHGELAVHRGAKVEATDGRIGQVDELLVNPKNSHITHLILREGHLWGQKDIIVPIAAIDRIEANHVYLKLDKAAVAALPAIPVKRWWH